VRIILNQPMDHASAARAFAVRSKNGRVPGTISWQGTTLIFKPSTELKGSVTYQAKLAPSAKSANDQASLGKQSSWSFRAAPDPKLVSLDPGQGKTTWAGYGPPAFPNGYSPCCGTNASGYSVSVLFNTPMNQSSLDHHLTITPKVDKFQTWFGPNQNDQYVYNISGDFAPSTGYTVELRPGVHDAFNRPLAGSLQYSFHTSEMHPLVALYGMPNTSMVSFSQGRVLRIPMQTIDMPKVSFTLVRTNLFDLNSSFNGCYQCQPSGAVVRRWSQTTAVATNRIENPGVEIKSKDGSPLPAGLYWLGATAPDTIAGWKGPDVGTEAWPLHTSEVLLVNNVSITAKSGRNGTLAWVTNPVGGKPLKSVQVRLVNYYGSKLVSAATGAQGVHIFHGYNSNGRHPVFAAVVNDGKHFGMAQLGWSPDTFSPSYFSYRPWQPGWGGSSSGTYAYTDRPIYRPGQWVHFRAVLWHDSDAVYSLQRPRTVTATVHNNQGKEIYHAKLALGRLGTIAGSFKLRSGASTGDSYLWIGSPSQPAASTTFTIAEYRKPEFLTTVKSAAPSYVQGSKAAVNVSVRYVFGAPVTNQRVQWTAYSQPLVQQPPGWDRYNFVDWESIWSQWWTWDGSQNAGYGELGKPIASGSGQTDSNGHLAIAVPVSLKKELLDRTVTVEVTATDANHQSVSGRTTVHEYHSDLAIGLKTDSETVAAGTSESIDVAAVRQDGTPLQNASLTAVISKRTYTSKLIKTSYGATVWQPVPHDTSVETKTISVDSAGKAVLTFMPKDGGEYRVMVSGADSSGNPSTTSISVYASRNGVTDWGTQQNTSLNLKPDRQTYSVGQTAHILVPAPFADASALVTVERGNIRRYWVTRLTTDADTVDVPIQLDDVPNEYVTVTIYHGWRGALAPDWRTGTAELHVRVDPRKLQVHLTQSGSKHHPGDTVAYTVSTTDMSGKQVSAQVSLALVDTSVLALKDQTNADILQAFYSEQPLGVSTSSEGTLSIDHLTFHPDFPILNNNNAADKAAAVPAAPPTAGGAGNQAAPRSLGFGGGGQTPQIASVRSHFADTAFWRGNVMTSASKRTTIRIRLPDNATTWQLDARAVNAAVSVGQATVKTLAARDLVLRPILPRFLVLGDALRVGVALNNRLDHAVRARISVSASGLSLPRARSTVQVPGKGERVLFWTATVPVSSTAVLTARAQPLTPGVQGDAVQAVVPVHPPLTDETTATAGQVYGSMRQAIVVPGGAVSVPGSLSVEVRSSITAGLGAAYGQLKPRSFESNDDVAERALAASSLHSLPQSITGLSRAAYNRLPIDTAVGVQKLLDKQWYDGGWPWFTDQYVIQSDPLVTADAVQALAASGRRGRQISNSLNRGRQYLQNQLGRVPASLRAHLLFVLSASGGVLSDRVEALYNDSIRRSHLDAGPLADLGTALHRDRPKALSVVSALEATAKVSATGAHWESADPTFYAGPPIENTAEVLTSLLAVAPNDPLEPAAARWLMLARQESGWDCNRDTAQAIAALTAYARAAREGRADYRYQVVLNGKRSLAGSYAPNSQRAVKSLSAPVASLRKPGSNTLDITRSLPGGSFGSGPLYYLARLHYYLRANTIQPRSQGVRVSRRFLNLAGQPISAVTAGSPVKVELMVHTDQSLVYLNIQDPIPAGCEPIDDSLNTSQQGIFKPASWYPWESTSSVGDLTWYLMHRDLRDDRVSLYAYYLPPGTYRYTYLMQATVAGKYAVPPTHASENFFPEVFGRSAGQTLVVR
jgi:uncharacterized protein YfaS (alpha-2-macroglobulin family)